MLHNRKKNPGNAGRETSTEQPQDRHGFEQTRSSVLGPAGHPDDPDRMQALGELFRKYLPPLKSYLKATFQWKFRVSDDWIDDSLQAFSMDKFVKGNLIGKFDQERGRFRDLLKKALFNFAMDRWRGEHGHRDIETEWPGTGSEDILGPADSGNPGLALDCDIVWARGVLDEALQKMKAECYEKNQRIVWVIFQRRMLTPLLESRKAESLNETVAFVEKAFGQPLSRDVSDYQTTGDRKLRRWVRDVLSEYCRDAEQIEEELEDLKQILRHGVHRKNPPTSAWQPNVTDTRT
jgi:hypothetical protein